MSRHFVPPSSGTSKQSTLSFTNKLPQKASLINSSSSNAARPGPGKALSGSGLNTLFSRTPSTGHPAKPSIQRTSSSLGKRSANSHEALRQTLHSEDSFAEEPVKVEEDKVVPTAKDALKQAVYWEEDDFEFDDMDLVELGLSGHSKQTNNAKPIPHATPKTNTAPPPPKAQPTSSPSANQWKNQFKIAPQAPAPPAEPAAKKRRTLPWKSKEEAEQKAKDAAELASILAIEKHKPAAETPRPAKHASALPWDKTASAVKAAKMDLKGKLQQQKRALSTASMGGNQDGKRGQKPTRHYMSNEQSHVLDMVVNEGKSVFFTGSAGTGKSVLLREIITGMRKKHKNYDSVAITASTGLAACNIGGVTLHSFSGIGLGREPVEQLVKKIRRNPKSKQRWLRTKVLIIDEISMVDGELFDKLEGVARTLKNNGRPFGGIQLVVTGDFFQLPPVPDNGRAAKFAFEGNTWSNCVDHTILLTHIFRQKDPVFASMLNEMRLGMLSPASVANFKKLNRKLEFDDGLQATELFPTRKEVDNANNMQLRKLTTTSEIYTAQDESAVLDQQQRDKLLANCMAPHVLELKVGAQVMLVKNMDETLVNGSLGRIVAFMSEKTYAMVTDEIPGGEELLFGSQGAEYEGLSTKQKAVFERYTNEQSKTSTTKRYPLVQWSIADGTQRRTLMLPEAWKFELPTGEIQASRKQVPLILAWALSIHKAQGQTLDRVKVDLNKVFEKGQAYVALSRATTQEGLQVLNFDARKVMAHDKVRSFYKSLTSAEAAAAGPSTSAASVKPVANSNKSVAKTEDDGFPDDDELEELHAAPAGAKLRQFAYS
ncbi:hypothetical protein H072_7026 [Dactylellina haptotyla CBS 200.50]|uniref:ATP-dependent DNA helicase PIF1 n=1 Tax=Dactylellina haptotyla (strain CBS 200.50) TaxID=1284197 RepID=S8BV51_DACHA|nr:hypothetical protein H072_7026 [Dactylellina haptotyla CBS 200.50]